MNKFTKNCMKIAMLVLVFATCNGVPPHSPTGPVSLDKVNEELKTSVAKKGFVSLDVFLLFFDQSKVSPKVKDVLSKIQITDPDIVITPKEISLKGMAKIGELAITVEVGLKEALGGTHARLAIGLPTGAKVSDIAPDLKHLEYVKFNAIQFYLANYDYNDPTTGIIIKSGVTFIGGVNVDSLLELIREKIAKNISEDEFKKSISKFFVTESLGLNAYAHIPFDLKDMHVIIEIPWKFGFDFEALKKKNGEPTFKNPFIQKLTTNKIAVDVKVGTALSVAISSDLEAHIRTQQNPLIFSGKGTISQTAIEFTGTMYGEYYPAFGLNFLAIGTLDPKLPPMTFSIGWDYAVAAATMAAIGFPFPTIGKEAVTIRIGQGDCATTGAALVSFSFKTAGVSELVIAGSIDKIDFACLIQALANLDKNKKLEVNNQAGKTPVKFTDLKLVVSLLPTEIFGIQYDSGVQAGAKVQIGKFYGSGDLIIGLTPKSPRFMAKMTMNPYEVKTKKGKIVFAIKGFKT